MSRSGGGNEHWSPGKQKTLMKTMQKLNGQTKLNMQHIYVGANVPILPYLMRIKRYKCLELCQRLLCISASQKLHNTLNN